MIAAAGSVVSRCLTMLRGKARPGVTTLELDEAAERFIRSQGGEPAFKGYRGFPGSICASPNSMVVHGIPGPYKLARGDVLSIDVGVILDGWVADAAITLAGHTVPLDRSATLVGLAGSVTTVAAMVLDLPTYHAAVIHHARLAAADVHRVTATLLAMTSAQRAALPFMHPGRVDVIGAGALVLSEVMERLGAESVVVSEHDILDGIAWSMVPAGPRIPR